MPVRDWRVEYEMDEPLSAEEIAEYEAQKNNPPSH
jgi:hypothetical protein